MAELKYQPVAYRRAYRLIILRKNLSLSEPKQSRLFDDYLYFLYITNDWKNTPAEIVYGANDRCNQENVWAQLKEARAFHAPLNTLLRNWAYMLIAAQAWNLKAWLALSMPPPKGRKREKQTAETGANRAVAGGVSHVREHIRTDSVPGRADEPQDRASVVGLESLAKRILPLGWAVHPPVALLTIRRAAASYGRRSTRPTDAETRMFRSAVASNQESNP